MTKLLDYLEDWKSGAIASPPVTRLLGIALVDFGSGTAHMEMKAGAEHHNPMGIVHGGILCDLADASMGVAVASTVGDGQDFTTTSLQISYLRPVVAARLTALSKVVHRGRTAIYVECEIRDPHSELIAKASSTCLLRASVEAG